MPNIAEKKSENNEIPLFSTEIFSMKEWSREKSNKTMGIAEGLVFQKIESDFPYLMPFSRYGCLNIPILSLFS